MEWETCFQKNEYWIGGMTIILIYRVEDLRINSNRIKQLLMGQIFIM